MSFSWLISLCFPAEGSTCSLVHHAASISKVHVIVFEQITNQVFGLNGSGDGYPMRTSLTVIHAKIVRFFILLEEDLTL